LLYIITTKNTCIQFDCDYMFYNVCYDGKEYNGVLRESKRNAEIQTIILRCANVSQPDSFV
jgi:hypothetical protein